MALKNPHATLGCGFFVFLLAQTGIFWTAAERIVTSVAFYLFMFWRE
ncbi:hypothetical protein [Phyllobacterium sp. SB3]